MYIYIYIIEIALFIQNVCKKKLVEVLKIMLASCGFSFEMCNSYSLFCDRNMVQDRTYKCIGY